jgi:hypothetical protein
MLGSEHPLAHGKHLALHLLRLIVLSLAREGCSQIARGREPLPVVLCTIAHLRPPRIRQTITHLACELLLARLARPPPPGTFLLLHERLRRRNAAAKMGQTRGPSTRASGLDGRRARAQADETHAILALTATHPGHEGLNLVNIGSITIILNC